MKRLWLMVKSDKVDRRATMTNEEIFSVFSVQVRLKIWLKQANEQISQPIPNKAFEIKNVLFESTPKKILYKTGNKKIKENILFIAEYILDAMAYHFLPSHHQFQFLPMRSKHRSSSSNNSSDC
mgnify:CR=1 FL=1